MLRPQSNSQSSGYTLLELLAALALTGLLSLVAFAALNLSLKAVRHGQATAEARQQLLVGVRYLERSLSSAALGTRDKKIRYYFVGEPQEMRFLTALPLEAHNLGGLYHMRVFVGQDESGQGCLTVEQCKILNWRQDPRIVEARIILIRNLRALRFTYGSDSEEYRTWNGRELKRLPKHVKIHLNLAGQGTHVCFVPIHVHEIL